MAKPLLVEVEVILFDSNLMLKFIQILLIQGKDTSALFTKVESMSVMVGLVKNFTDMCKLVFFIQLLMYYKIVYR